MLIVPIAPIRVSVEHSRIAAKLFPTLLHLELVIRETGVIDDMRVPYGIELTESLRAIAASSFPYTLTIKRPFSIFSVNSGQKINIVVRYQ